jgi:hypothetical protein
MTNVDVAALRQNQAFARMQADQQMREQAGSASSDFSSAGPPTWSRAAWDSFFNQYGRYPYSANELPPSFEACPSWAYELMGLREPPVQVMGGGNSTGSSRVDNLGVWGIR